MCLRDGGALRSLGRQQSRATRRDQRAPVLNMFPPSDIHDRRRPSIKIWVDGLFGSSCPILGHLVRDRRAPPSRRRTDHDRSERTSPVPSSTSVVDARHPPPQMTMANSRAISCRFGSSWSGFRLQHRLGVKSAKFGQLVLLQSAASGCNFIGLVVTRESWRVFFEGKSCAVRSRSPANQKRPRSAVLKRPVCASLCCRQHSAGSCHIPCCAIRGPALA